MKQTFWVALLCLMVGCAGDQNKENEQAAKKQTPDSPKGTWFMYAGSETGLRSAEDLDRELTVLVLDDSTYSLTMMEPQIQRNFVEKGQVDYDLRNGQMKFVVYSSTGVDFSGTEPRKLVDVDLLVPWQREPGTEYVMLWELKEQGDESGDNVREVMVLSAEEAEISYFVRLENKDMAQGGDLDIPMKESK